LIHTDGEMKIGGLPPLALNQGYRAPHLSYSTDRGIPDSLPCIFSKQLRFIFVHIRAKIITTITPNENDLLKQFRNRALKHWL